MSSFYVGYLPKMPDDLARFLRRVLRVLVTGGAALAALLIVAQQRFSPAFFEWQQVREFQGSIEEHPYPMLVVKRPGANAGSSRYLLVGVGKSGASKDVAGLDGRPVSLKGKLIYRPETALIEVMPNSVRATGESAPVEGLVPESPIRVQGEIVDSKCYGGVMNPGRGKVHRDCAVRCLSGGVPPVLVTRNEKGETTLYELVDSGGSPPPTSRFLNRVAEPVWVTGKAFRRGSANLIAIEAIE